MGDLEFDSEQEYLDASRDLKKIKAIMEKHDITKPEEAKIVLKEVTDKPVFASSYGLKFVEKLEKTATGVKAAETTHRGRNGNNGSDTKPMKRSRYENSRRGLTAGQSSFIIKGQRKIFYAKEQLL